MFTQQKIALALGVAATISVGASIVLYEKNVNLERSVVEARAELQKVRAEAVAWNTNHPVPQDSASAFMSNYGASLLRIHLRLDRYSKDQSEDNKQQLLQALDDFVQFAHAWQDLMSATAPMLSAAIPQFAASGQSGDIPQMERLLAELNQGANKAGGEVNRSITSVYKVSGPHQ